MEVRLRFQIALYKPLYALQYDNVVFIILFNSPRCLRDEVPKARHEPEHRNDPTHVSTISNRPFAWERKDSQWLQRNNSIPTCKQASDEWESRGPCLSETGYPSYDTIISVTMV